MTIDIFHIQIILSAQKVILLIHIVVLIIYKIHLVMQISITLYSRPSYNNPLGGDVIQMLKTKEWLGILYGVHISIITHPNGLTANFNIVHVFSFTTCEITNDFVKKARQLEIPIISSCIYWDYSYPIPPLRYFTGYPSHIEKFFVLFYHFLYEDVTAFLKKPKGVSRGFKRYTQKFIGYSRFILSNSIEEGNLFLDFVGIKKADKIRVVYNGVELKDTRILPPELFFSRYKLPRDYILQVGRIEYLKNQLSLLYALRGHIGIPIVFTGQISDAKYGRRLHKITQERGNVFFLNKVPYDEIASFYHCAALHVLLSLRGSPDLVSMEAAAQGRPIVIPTSECLPKKIYFSKAPYVVDPLDISVVEQVLLQACQERKKSDLNIKDFSRSSVAIQTYDVYREVMDKTY